MLQVVVLRTGKRPQVVRNLIFLCILNASISYKVGKDECAIYFYLEPFSFRPASGSVTFFVDGKPFGVTNYKTYLFRKQPPGEIHIGAYQFRITIQCRAGEKIYIKAVESWKSYKRGKDLCPVIVAEGEKAIRSRKLALSY
jgi:hypothetical protein